MSYRVTIIVRGGVAEVLNKPQGVELLIRDYDTQGQDDVTHDSQGDPCIESLREANEIIENGCQVIPPVCCPRCGTELTRYADFPDTGTTVEMWEGQCAACQRHFVVSHELQDNSIEIREMDAPDEGAERQ
jgi:hypothetical protein